ncbi:MAG TPA: BTAD domain-containing putative transcriptional regulator [Streptosporangiaceae bacterium]
MSAPSQMPPARSGRSPGLILRPRVATLLSGALHRRAMLVVAGAGYGKTTALSEIASTIPSRWVRLRPADAQAESLSARIATSLGEPPSPGGSAIAAATGSDDRTVLAERRAAQLCELAEALPDDVLLILDGAEHLGADEAASHLLRVLSLQAPSQLHLVLSGRSLPELGLGGAQGRGELLEVTAPDLSFTRGETTQLVEMRLGAAGVPLAADCWSLTAGWPAALQLLLDRLERLEPGDRARALERLRLSRGQPWRAFARDLIGDEQQSVRQVLLVASAAPRVDAGLLAGADVPASVDDLASMQERGLLVEAGEPGFYRLSPVLADAAESAAAPGQAGELRSRLAGWLEAHGRLEEALECHAAADRAAAQAFLLRRGPALIRTGAASRLIDVQRAHGTGGDPALDAVLAEALQAVGDWDAAIELFARVERASGAAGLAAAVAWRYGVLLYLRGNSAAAAASLTAAHNPAALGADDAMVSASLSNTYWSQGQVDAADDLARKALHQAGASGDSCALAAAHVALALVAASRGERERNELEYRLALTAAREGGDRVQLARIHANLSSRALENGDYQLAIAEAELALETGSGHRFFSALALINKADAHLRTGQLGAASAAIADADAICAALGTLLAAIPQVLSGELYRQRGDQVRARNSFERAVALAAEGDDAHTLVSALCGLARILVEEDLAAARKAVADALTRASGLERATALCTAAEVELRGRDNLAAEVFARQAEAQARATGDRAALAESLELQAAAQGEGGQRRLSAAIELWDDVGNPVAAARARLALAVLSDDQQAADTRRQQLGEMGVTASLGAPGLLASASRNAREMAVVALGRFAVLHAGEPVPLAAWQSRKARDLLKLLVARRGRPLTREAAAEVMWPDVEPDALSNRLSVALSTIRKVLDPDRQHPADHYLVSDARTIALRTDHIYIDFIEFLRLADRATELLTGGEPEAAEAPLRRARQLYAGDFLEEDLYEEWATDARAKARARLLAVLRALSRLGTERGDHESAAQYLGQLLEREPYDEDAWLSLVANQLRLRRHGEARRHYATYARRMDELDVVPVALADAADWRP